MEFDVVILGVVIGFMVLANRLVAMLIKPLFVKYDLDSFWLAYIAWAASGVLVAFTKANLFVNYIPNQTIGMILTAIVAGGGANLLHDLTDKPDQALLFSSQLTSDDDEHSQ